MHALLLATAAMLFPSVAMAQATGNGKGDCDDRRGPNATKCLYFGNPYYDSATGTFSGSINPYYNPATGTFSSLAPRAAVVNEPRRVRRRAP